MDCILDGRYSLNFPCLEHDRVFEAASLLALLRNPRFGIAGRGQSDLNWEFAIILPDRRKGIGVNNTRVIGVNVGGNSVRFCQFLVDRDILEHPATKVLEDMQVLGKKRDVKPEDGADLLGDVRLRFFDTNVQLFGGVRLSKHSLGNLAEEERLVSIGTGYLRYAGK